MRWRGCVTPKQLEHWQVGLRVFCPPVTILEDNTSIITVSWFGGCEASWCMWARGIAGVQTRFCLVVSME